MNGGLINGDGDLELARILSRAEKEQVTSLTHETRWRSRIRIPVTNIFHSNNVVAKNTNF
jgi:hypothetical protein